MALGLDRAQRSGLKSGVMTRRGRMQCLTSGRGALAVSIAVLALATAGLAACTTNPPPLHGIHKIRHVLIIMEENRSFDSFVGTYPGADGLPAKNGQFTVCVPNPRTHGCDRPYHDPSPVERRRGARPR